ncbi:unnamed protein product, partial [Lampetra fluviatilis]
LRPALLNDAKEVRAAALRSLRYLITDSETLRQALQLRVDFLIARCVDIQQSNEVERTQALRLVRKMISVDASSFPASLTNSLVAVGNDGTHERDRMVRSCLAILCELAVGNPAAVAVRGGLSTLVRAVVDSHHPRITESLVATAMHLVNHPDTRSLVRPHVDIEQILAPFTDFHYRHHPETTDSQL